MQYAIGMWITDAAMTENPVGIPAAVKSLGSVVGQNFQQFQLWVLLCLSLPISNDREKGTSHRSVVRKKWDSKWKALSISLRTVIT